MEEREEVVCIFAQSRFRRSFAARFRRSGLLPASDREKEVAKNFLQFSERETFLVGIFHPAQSALCFLAREREILLCATH